MTAALLFGCSACHAQNQPAPPPFSMETDHPSFANQHSDAVLRRRNAERQKMIRNDTQLLLAIAGELKTSISNGDATNAMIHQRTEQMERLAKAIKELMRG